MPARNMNCSTRGQGARTQRSSGKPMSRRRADLRVEGLEDRCLLSAAPELIADLNVNHVIAGPILNTAFENGEGTPFSSPFVKSGQLMVVNGTLYFTAVDLSGNLGLWATPANGYSTELHEFTNAGSTLGNMTAVNSILFFTVGSELWESNGTPTGTCMVQDIDANGSASFDDFTAVNDKLFFTANDGVDGDQLWVSDGTTSGTKMVDPIAPGSDGSYPSIFAVAGGLVYFKASDGSQGTSLWRSDGTQTGTIQLAELGPGLYGGPAFRTYRYSYHGTLAGRGPGAADVDGTLYFVNDNQLWKSNGTAAGTVELIEFRSNNFYDSTIYDLTSFNGKLFFIGFDDIDDGQLWTSNGTAAGTVAVSDFTPDPYGPTAILTTFNGSLYYTAPNSQGTGLWTTDGSGPGTFLAETGGAGNPTAFDGELYFTGSGGDLWKTDGAVTGTVELPYFPLSGIDELAAGTDQLYFAGSGSVGGTDGTAYPGTWTNNRDIENDLYTTGRYNFLGYPNHLTPFNNHLLFELLSPNSGSYNPLYPPPPGDGPQADQIWVANDLGEGLDSASPFNGFSPNTYSSNPTDFTDVNGTEFFIAGNQSVGLTQNTELWKTNGTAAGTVLVKDFQTGFYQGYEYDVTDLTNVNGTLFFMANDGIHGNQLWTSNGTSTGTVMLSDVNATNRGLYYVYDLTAVGGNLFLTAADGVHGSQLWESNGIAAGTVMVTDINASGGGFYAYDLTAVGGNLFFAADDSVDGRQIWTSNGTCSGTVVVSDVNASGGGFYPYVSDLTAVGWNLFFTASDGASGYQLWVSNGTALGTVMVTDVEDTTANHYGVPYSFDPVNLTDVNGTLFFTANDGIHGGQLWKSDGTAAGTVMFSDVNPSGGGLSPADLTAVGCKLFFTTNDGTDGTQLWESDETTGVTQMVSDVNPGVGFSSIGNLTNVNGMLYFAADDGTDGTQIWESDGTSTTMVSDVNPGVGLSSVSNLTNVGGTLIFAADDGTHGVEPWKLVSNPVPPTLTSLASSSQTSVSGQSLTLTATVAGPTPLEDAPTGTVTFADTVSGNTCTLGIVTLDGTGTAVLPVALTTVGMHEITATYSGDNSSISLPQTVNALSAPNLQSVVDTSQESGSTAPITIQAATSSSLSSSLQAVNGVSNASSSPVTVALDLGGASATPTAAINLSSGVQVDLTSSGGNATAQGVMVSAGTVVIEASVAPVDWTVNGGNVTVEGSAAAGDFVVNGGTVTLADGTVITGNSPAITLNAGTVILQGVTAQTATNSPTIIVNGGNLLVRDSTIESSTGYAQAAILINGGSVDLGTVASPGDNILNANDGGQLVFNATSSSVPDIGNTLEVSGTALTAPYLSFTALASSAGSSVDGQSVTLAAAVRAANPTDGTPTGTVDFVDTTTGANLGTATVTNGVATLCISTLSIGSHTIAAVYAGDDNFAFSIGSVTQVVNKANTSATIATSLTPSVRGQAVTFTATVSVVSPGSNAVANPTSTVDFYDGATEIGSGTLSGTNTDQASFTTSALSVGSQSITAAYVDDTNFNPSTSGALTQVINKASPTLATTPNTTVVPQSTATTLNDTAALSGGYNETGTITFTLYHGGTQLATNSVTVSGNGSYTSAGYSLPSSAAVGVYHWDVTYNGDGNNNSVADNNDPAEQVTVVSPCCNLTGVTFSVYNPSNGTTTTVNNLRGNTQQGDTVTANFTVPSGDFDQLSLAGYNAPEPFYEADDANLQTVSSSLTQVFGPGSFSLGPITLPSNFYQVDFVCGTVITTLGLNANDFYSAQNRLISADNEGANPTGSGVLSVTGEVYSDLNLNGQLNNGEPGLAGVTVTLTGTDAYGNSISETTTTNGSGIYTFSGLPFSDSAGYAVSVSPPSGESDGKATAGSVAGVADGTATTSPEGVTGIVLANSGQTTGTGYNLGIITSSCVTGSDYSTVVLNATARGALTISGNARVSVPGAIIVDSSSTAAISGSGTASLTASIIDVVGGYQKASGETFSPSPADGAAPLTDPLASLPVPTTSGVTNDGSVSLTSGSRTISPGIYTQIKVSGGTLTMNPGTYIIKGGGFAISGSANVSGSGVTIFNAGSNCPSTGGTFGSINWSSTGTFNLSAPTSGTYSGILIFQSRDNAQSMSINVSGSAGSAITGTIYAAAAQLVDGGATPLTGSLIVNLLTITTGATANSLAAPDGTVAYTPNQIRDAYGINNLSLDGTGQTIAIVDAYDDPDIIQALDAFDAQFTLTDSGPTLYDQYGPASSFLTVLNQFGQATSLPDTDPNGPGTDNWEVEESLDVEWAHAIAPGAQIILVEANSQSLSDLMASVATAASQPGVSVVSISWGFAEGQAVFASDEATYDSVFTTTGVTFVASTGDYGAADPEYPAYSPNVVAVGGTSLTLNSDNSYNSETGWGYYSNSVGAFIGSGGGISLYEPEPAYQQGIQSTGYRTTPDVSLVADPATGAWIADPYNLDPSNPFEIVGGTSLSAPAWAGLVALVNQGRAAAGESTLNSSTPTDTQQALYMLPQSDYNVIASGTNGYTAGAGYNLVTGLGTPVANLLVPDLIAYQGPGTSYSGPTVAALQSTGLINTGTSDGGPMDVFSVFDSLTVASNGVGDSQGQVFGIGIGSPLNATLAPAGAGRIATSPVVATSFTSGRASSLSLAGLTPLPLSLPSFPSR